MGRSSKKIINIYNLNDNYLISLIKKLKQGSILVIGDLILDRYIFGETERVSREAPIPVIVLNKENEVLGGAGNTYANIKSIGAKAFLLSRVGSDEYGKRLKLMVKGQNGLILDKGWTTTIKTRIIARNQQVARLDWEKDKHPSKNTERKIISELKKISGKVNTMLISDYGIGFFTKRIISEILKFKGKKILFVIRL